MSVYLTTTADIPNQFSISYCRAFGPEEAPEAFPFLVVTHTADLHGVVALCLVAQLRRLLIVAEVGAYLHIFRVSREAES